MPDDALTLSSDEVSVVVLPDHGADIHALVHRATGVDVLFKPPWPPVERRLGTGDTQVDWLADYRGGWQVLLPNAGDECRRHGAVWGFHGEASTVPWSVETADGSAAALSAQLRTAPLTVRRTLTVRGPTVRVEETVANLGPEPCEVMYVHHPAYGEPLIGGDARLDVGASTVVTDPVAPGSLAPADQVSTWPWLPTRDGDVDLRRLPDPTRPRELLAYLTDVDEPYYAITNPGLGLGVAVRWTAETLPHAWLWQEIHHSTGYPWYRRACAVAVEPASTFPAHGLSDVNGRGGRGLVIPAREEVVAAVEATLFVPPPDFAAVSGVEWDGAVRIESEEGA